MTYDEKKISAMREGGAKLADILDELLDVAKPGVNLLDIEALAIKRIKSSGGTPSFTTVSGYKWATCLCVNEVVVHGIPYSYELKENDLLTIDVGLLFKEYHTDTAGSKIIVHPSKQPKSEAKRFLDTGKKAISEAISMARIGNRVGHISHALQSIVEGAGYGIVKSLVGHGVGKTLHEAPQIPGIVRGAIDRTPALVAGQTLAIEVIYTMGKPAVWYPNDDGWSIATRDGSLAAVFEDTIAILEHGTEVLT